MAVPSSGQIDMNSIKNELLASNYSSGTAATTPIGLKELSDGSIATINANNSPYMPNGASPHMMSEFYSYNHDEGTGGGM